MYKIENVTKKIKGKVIFDTINYSFEHGKIYGVSGKNGAGKTMLLRLLAGLIKPTSGEVWIDDIRLGDTIAYPPSLGLVIENMQMLPHMTAYENLLSISAIKKIADENDIKNALVRVGLESEEKVRKFSLGMKQRLNIAQAIFERPDLILLDEPTNALDKDGVEFFYQIILEEKRRGACIIIATHDQDVLERCDQIYHLELK